MSQHNDLIPLRHMLEHASEAVSGGHGPPYGT